MHLSVESAPRELLSYETSIYKGSSDQAQFVQKLNSAIHRINHYSVNKC